MHLLSVVLCKVNYKSGTCIHAHMNWHTCLLEEQNAVPSSLTSGRMLGTRL